MVKWLECWALTPRDHDSNPGAAGLWFGSCLAVELKRGRFSLPYIACIF